MTRNRFSALDGDVSALVRRSAVIEPAPRGARARVLAGVEAAIVSEVGSSGGDSTGSTSSAAERAVERGVTLAAGIVVGGALGALVMYQHMRPTAHAAAALPPSPPPSVATAVVEPAHAPAIDVAGSPTSAPRIRPRHDVAVPPALTSVPAAAPPAMAPDRLAEERSLLDAARRAVEREDGAEALTATEEHARKYPSGVLAQEREAIAVRALLLVGRNAEARARVARFRATFPDSLLLPTLESSVEAAGGP